MCFLTCCHEGVGQRVASSNTIGSFPDVAYLRESASFLLFLGMDSTLRTFCRALTRCSMLYVVRGGHSRFGNLFFGSCWKGLGLGPLWPVVTTSC